MTLLDGLAYAYEANVSVVIPPARPSADRGATDWSLDDLIDVEFLASHIGHNITIYRQAPVPLPRIVVQSQKMDLNPVPPRQRAGVLREAFDKQQLVHLTCPHFTFLWTMPYQAQLRRDIILGFRPPKSMSTLMSQLTLTRAKGYNCLAERLDDSWLQFCHEAEQRTDNLRVMSVKECFLSARRLLDYVSHSHLSNAPALFVSGHNTSFVAQLAHAGVKTYSSVSVVGVAAPLVPRDMFDWFVCLSANVSAVNSYSSLGFLQREARTLMRAGPTDYYNQEPTFCPRLLCKEEQRRWHLDAVLYTSPEEHRRTWVSEMKVNGLTVSGLLRVAKSCRFNFGVGWSCKTAPFTFSCSVDGKVHHPITATLVERPMSGDYEFSWRLPFSRPGRYVAHIWAHSEQVNFEMDGSPVPFDVPGMNFFLYGNPSHNCMRGLYQLHHELLRRFGNMSYIHPRVETLTTPLSRVHEPWSEDVLSPRDVLIVSDSDFPQDAAQRLTARGIKIVRWILEQPTDIVSELHNTGGLLPLCSSHHFVEQYACPPKALVGRPVAANIVQASHRGTLCNRLGACPKRDVVLIDHDAHEQAATGISLEQLQAALTSKTEVMPFAESVANDLIDQYKRARVAVDLFVSGNEPLLLEAALFNVCPLVARHGAARDPRDLPLPRSLFLSIDDAASVARQIAQTMAKCNASLLAPLKTQALALHDQFPAQVATFFSDNVLFYIICRTQEDEDWAMPTALALLINYPFADIEIVVRSEYFFRYDNAVVFELLGRKSFAKSVTVTQRNGVDRNHHLDEDMFMVSRPMARHLNAWIYQWPAGDIALSPELVQENVGLYEEAMEGTDRMTAVLRRAPLESAAGGGGDANGDGDDKAEAEAGTARERRASAAPQFFFQQDLHFDMLAIHDARAATATKPPQKLAVAADAAAAEAEAEVVEAEVQASDMRSETTAEELGFLLLKEPMSGTWRVGGPHTQSMCDNWARTREHELWRSVAGFHAEGVREALAELTKSCTPQAEPVRELREEERDVDAEEAA